MLCSGERSCGRKSDLVTLIISSLYLSSCDWLRCPLHCPSKRVHLTTTSAAIITDSVVAFVRLVQSWLRSQSWTGKMLLARFWSSEVCHSFHLRKSIPLPIAITWGHSTACWSRPQLLIYCLNDLSCCRSCFNCWPFSIRWCTIWDWYLIQPGRLSRFLNRYCFRYMVSRSLCCLIILLPSPLNFHYFSWLINWLLYSLTCSNIQYSNY